MQMSRKLIYPQGNFFKEILESKLKIEMESLHVRNALVS